MEITQLKDYLANEDKLVKLLREVNAARAGNNKPEVALATVKQEYTLAIAASEAVGDADRKTAMKSLIDYQTAHGL